MCLTNERSEYLFGDSTTDQNVYYTLTDKYGNVLRARELSVKLEVFISTMVKSSYKQIKDLI
jgi:hypothetical protein